MVMMVLGMGLFVRYLGEISNENPPTVVALAWVSLGMLFLILIMKYGDLYRRRGEPIGLGDLRVGVQYFILSQITHSAGCVDKGIVRHEVLVYPSDETGSQVWVRVNNPLPEGSEEFYVCSARDVRDRLIPGHVDLHVTIKGQASITTITLPS